MSNTFRALRSRNYRLFFSGQILSLIGSWMENLAMSWLVYRLTHSELLLGTVSFSSQIPMFLISPIAGVVTDRIHKRKLLVITQTLAMLLALTLALLVLTNRIQPWHIIVLSVFVGIVNAFDMPGRQAFVPQLVENREDLGNAIALNSTMFNAARLIGPAIAGFTVHLAGEGVCFAINSASFLCVIFALLKMTTVEPVRDKVPAHPLRELREGMAYTMNFHPIRVLLQLIAIASLAAGGYSVMMPVFAADVYHGSSNTLALQLGAAGVGALIASTMLARRASVVGLGGWILMASSTFGVALALFGLTRSLYVGLPLLVLIGFGSILHMGATNTLLQTFVADHMRGRVMAFYTMSFVGTMPIGSLLGGWMGSHFGPAITLGTMGVLTLLGALSFYRNLPEFRRVLTPIYEERGILPSSPKSVDAAG